MRSILFSIRLIFTFGGQTQEEEEPHTWKVELFDALNNNSAWEVELSVTYLPIPYVGITMRLLFCNMIEKDSCAGFSRDNQWLRDSDEGNPGYRLSASRPVIQLVTPAFKFEKDKGTGFSLAVSSGLAIPLSVSQEFNINYIPNTPGVWVPQRPDHIENKEGKPLFYHIRSMPGLDIDQQYISSLGYTPLNFDLYSEGRNFVMEGRRLSVPRTRFMHSFFLSIGYRL